jgi:hypothetical protein
MSRNSRLLAVVGLALSLIAAGCNPQNVAWLPDSSGFVYSSDSGTKLIHYDVATKKQRVIVENTDTNTVWPAISPDGKRIAVARFMTCSDVKGRATGWQVEVIFYDLAGKLVQRSKAERWGEKVGKNGKIQDTFLVWAPDGKHIVVYCLGTVRFGVFTDIPSDPCITLLYDVKNGTFTCRKNGDPIPFGGNPFRPDGKGILVEKRGEISFLEVTGKEHEITLPEVNYDDRKVMQELMAPWLISSSWKGDVATSHRGSAILTIDTAKLKATFDPEGRKGRMPEPKDLRWEYDLAGGRILRVLENSSSSFRIEAFDPKSKKSRFIYGPVEIDCMVIPSPDRKHAAIREGRGIVVVNAKGEIVSDNNK